MKKFNQEENEDNSTKADMGTQLDGVLRDILSWWENVKYQNSINLDQQWINSSNSCFSNMLSKRQFKDSITKEFNFFDVTYF